MASDKARILVNGGFTPGTKVGLTPRFGDVFPARNARAEQTATVGKDASVEFTGLKEGDRYWVFSLEDDDRRALSATAKTPEQGKKRLTAAEITERLSQTTPHRGKGNTITGARTTTNTRVLSSGGLQMRDGVGVPTSKDELEHEPQPRLRQEDARNVPQRSATLTGSAHPVEAGEPQPLPRQEDFQNVPQRSATPLGEATPIIPKPETQEDAKRLHQRSATPEGVAVPKPEGDPVHQALTRDASVKQAAGLTRQADKPEPASKAGEQRKAKPKQSGVKKAKSAGSEVKQATKKDASVRKQISKSAEDQSKNEGNR